MLPYQHTPLVHAKLHDGTVEIGLGNYLGADVRFFYVVDQGRGGKAGRVVDVQDFPLGSIDLVGDVRNGRNDIHVELPEQAFLDYFKMEEAQETAPEAETEGQRRLRLIDKGSVVELKLLQSRAKFLELVGLDRIHARKDHGLDLLETGDGRLARTGRMGDCVANLHFNGPLDTGYDVAHVSSGNLAGGLELHLQDADLLGIIFHTGGHEFDLVPRRDGTVQDLEVGYDATELVEYGIEYQSLKRGVGIALRGGDLLDNRIQQRRDAFAGAR